MNNTNTRKTSTCSHARANSIRQFRIQSRDIGADERRFRDFSDPIMEVRYFVLPRLPLMMPSKCELPQFESRQLSLSTINFKDTRCAQLLSWHPIKQAG